MRTTNVFGFRDGLKNQLLCGGHVAGSGQRPPPPELAPYWCCVWTATRMMHVCACCDAKKHMRRRLGATISQYYGQFGTTATPAQDTDRFTPVHNTTSSIPGRPSTARSSSTRSPLFRTPHIHTLSYVHTWKTFHRLGRISSTRSPVVQRDPTFTLYQNYEFTPGRPSTAPVATPPPGRPSLRTTLH
eukprot:363745-Chlamydomonas_euryale.AAC.1